MGGRRCFMLCSANPCMFSLIQSQIAQPTDRGLPTQRWLFIWKASLLRFCVFIKSPDRLCEVNWYQTCMKDAHYFVPSAHHTSAGWPEDRASCIWPVYAWGLFLRCIMSPDHRPSSSSLSSPWLYQQCNSCLREDKEMDKSQTVMLSEINQPFWALTHEHSEQFLSVVVILLSKLIL